jgi:hypothetical protein
VTLTTSTLAENVDYTLTVNNVRDRATSPNSIESNSTIAFQLVNVVTLDQRIASGADDVEEGQDGGMIPASSDLELVVNSGDVQTVGLRYDLPIPQGATIVNAYVQFQVDEVSTGAASLSIEAHASDDAPAFTSTNGDLASRPRTSASTAWVPAAWPTVGAQGLDQRTPNIASVLQEIVDRPGWTAGNSLVLILGGSGTRIAEAYNGDSTAAALLHVEYGPAAAAAPPLPPENPQVRGRRRRGSPSSRSGEDSLFAVPTCRLRGALLEIDPRLEAQGLPRLLHREVETLAVEVDPARV